MNNTLILKGKLQTRRAQRPGAPALPVGKSVDVSDVEAKIASLQTVRDYWREQPPIINPLVEVHYRQVVAKSNRIKQLLSGHGKRANDSIVGARFEPIESKLSTYDGSKQTSNQGGTRMRHVITHYVTMDTIDSTLTDLEACKTILEHHGGSINDEQLATITKAGLSKIDERAGLSKTTFAQLIRDIYFVDHFDVKSEVNNPKYRALVTLYDTGRDAGQTVSLLNSLGVNVISTSLLDPTTINLLPEQYGKLVETAPYLIAMAQKNILDLKVETSTKQNPQDARDPQNEYGLSVPPPHNEPIVGVIDTRFDETAYFADWVEYHDDLIDPQLGVDPEDYAHGTEVDSIIVDGPALNPALEDGCGRFRVRHFAVAKNGKNSSFSILKSIRHIVETNQDITVWNLCLGSTEEALENTISPEGAMLDELQEKYGVIFVVAGTNKTSKDSPDTPKRIGAPADSVNALVVNATSILREPASYTREGPVLHFFRKPDISYFGGDNYGDMAVWSPGGVATTRGTSFAAPWITRKLAYLVHVMHLSREAAKALIIDAASGWEPISADNIKLGYGIVPTRIEDILETPSNEIRFVLEGTIDTFETYNYNIPVPMKDGKYPYMARATLCYFPKCDKRQGVDYTDTELDFHFGRMKTSGIDSLDNNIQGDPFARTYEDTARKMYRKWDNVKHVSDIEKRSFRLRVSHGIPYWGFKIRKTERFDPPVDKNGNVGKNAGDGLRFGIVVTLRGMDGRNRFDEFKMQCQLQSEPWIVEEIDMNTNIKIYQEADAEITFDDETEK